MSGGKAVITVILGNRVSKVKLKKSEDIEYMDLRHSNIIIFLYTYFIFMWVVSLPLYPWASPGQVFYEQLKLIYANQSLSLMLENSDQLLAYDGGAFVWAVLAKLESWG